MSDSFKSRMDVRLMSAALFPTLIRREDFGLREDAGWLLPADRKIRFITCPSSENDLNLKSGCFGNQFFLRLFQQIYGVSSGIADLFILKDFSCCCITKRLDDFDLQFTVCHLGGMSLIRSHVQLFKLKKKNFFVVLIHSKLGP